MSNWKEKTLSEYCEFQEGYVNPPKGHSEYFGGDIKWCRAVDINNGYVYSTSQTLTDAGFNSVLCFLNLIQLLLLNQVQ